jgi:hypothetical protein
LNASAGTPRKLCYHPRSETSEQGTKRKKTMEMKLAAILVLGCAVSAVAQTQVLVSKDYPLQANIIAVEMRTASSPTQGVSTDSDGNVSGGGGGGTYTWHLMKTVIGDKLYGLAVPLSQFRGPFGIPLGHRAWLEIGSYSAKRVKDGFELQYLDNKKVRHETLLIQSEEPYPAQGK